MKILIADPHPGIRSALSFLLSTDIPSAAILQAGCRLHLLETCAVQQPDCILLDPFEIVRSDRDVSLTETDLVRQIENICAHAFLIGMSSRVDTADRFHNTGIEIWVHKTDTPDLLVSAIFTYLRPVPHQKPGHMDR